MIPVYQTLFGDGSDGTPCGNCFAACIASLLELPLDALPNFCALEGWREATDRWLGDRGFFYLDVAPGPGFSPETAFGRAGYHIMSGPGPRGLRHSVVGRAGRMVHDPHPSGDGVIAEEYDFLIPLDPAARWLRA